jgi:ribonuclease E
MTLTDNDFIAGEGDIPDEGLPDLGDGITAEVEEDFDDSDIDSDDEFEDDEFDDGEDEDESDDEDEDEDDGDEI